MEIFKPIRTFRPMDVQAAIPANRGAHLHSSLHVKNEVATLLSFSFASSSFFSFGVRYVFRKKPPNTDEPELTID